jgi:hypothetical protein
VVSVCPAALLLASRGQSEICNLGIFNLDGNLGNGNRKSIRESEIYLESKMTLI